jgi:hypothetical protein
LGGAARSGRGVERAFKRPTIIGGDALVEPEQVLHGRGNQSEVPVAGVAVAEHETCVLMIGTPGRDLHRDL